MNMMQYVKENEVVNLLFIGLLIVLIFRFSGAIVTSIFNIGSELGRAIGGAIWG